MSHTACGKDVLEADVKGRIRCRCESHPLFPDNIFWPSVLIPNGILDLDSASTIELTNPANPRRAPSPGFPYEATHMHIDHLPITFLPTDSRRHDNESILGNEISDASLMFGAVPWECLKVEFQRPR